MIRTINLLLFITVLSNFTYAQENTILYDNDLLSKEFHAKRRQALRDLMPDSSACIVFAATTKIKSNDISYEFHQNANFYYLTGLKKPNAILIIFKNKTVLDSITTNELLFFNEKDEISDKWNGKDLNIADITINYGIRTSNSKMIEKLDFESLPVSRLYIDNTEIDNYSILDTDLAKPIRELLSINNTYKYNTSSIIEWLAKLRQIKQPEELILLQKAIKITCNSFNEMIKAVTTSTAEYQAEAMVEYLFKQAGAEDVGYPSICGAGENGTILHYSDNRKKAKNGELLVIDAGAEYHGYSADVTRTIPVNGKFTKEQLLLYNLVLKAQNAAIEQCKSGNSFYDPHFTACKVIKEGLKELGIIKNEIDYKKYFWHGTSHYLGLDVHDVGTYEKLKPNTVITVEPGIYIKAGADCDKKWWNIGIRIEDDILITNELPVILSKETPKKIEELELLMQQKSFFNTKTNNGLH